MSEDNEPYPVHETVKVLDGRTIFKTAKWWQAVILANMFGHDKIMIYLWQNKDGQWKRKHKFGINFVKDWEKLKVAVDEFIPRIRTIQ